MKPLSFLIATFLLSNLAQAQHEWYETFPDTTSIKVKCAELVQDFQGMITAVDPTIDLQDPSPAFSAWGPFYLQPQNTIYLPLWDLSPMELKAFCTELGGGELEGERMFGLFFNGFYVAHEVAHALQFASHARADNEYDNEYTANVIALLYWREKGKQKELKACYQLAKTALLKLKNPIPEGEDAKAYFTEHYWELAKDPYQYGYIQFYQFVLVYEDKTLSDFNGFIKENIIQK
ncbi:hypothetical protein [Flagellimonas amoyensis]|uniref:hypothetical protein n=1 Tax=Flagellimonas amoyensis TaxID=2169401 RepID=UPI000D33A439|nr:hypothetical protein [Allomuricauda amoyensis]